MDDLRNLGPTHRIIVRSREVGSLNYRISTAAEVPVKFQSDRTFVNTNLAASRLRDIDIEAGPQVLMRLYSLE